MSVAASVLYVTGPDDKQTHVLLYDGDRVRPSADVSTVAVYRRKAKVPAFTLQSASYTIRPLPVHIRWLHGVA